MTTYHLIIPKQKQTKKKTNRKQKNKRRKKQNQVTVITINNQFSVYVMFAITSFERVFITSLNNLRFPSVKTIGERVPNSWAIATQNLSSKSHLGCFRFC